MSNSYNNAALRLLQTLAERATELRIADSGNRILDCGVHVPGGLEAGLMLSRICMGDAADIRLVMEQGMHQVQVFTDQPGKACMGSQYGGWPVANDQFFAIGSGPVRLKRGKEKVLEQYGWQETAAEGFVGVLETASLPDEATCEQMADECGIELDQLHLCVAPTRSLAGSMQIVARSVEATMHKLFELEVNLSAVTSATGTAPLPPVAPDDLTGIGRTNDAILYGGRVMLWVDLTDEQIAEFGPSTPSNSSSEFGRSFAQMFEASGRDFYKLDPMIFSAAQVSFVSNSSGRMHTFGELRPDLVQQSFA